MGHSDKHLTKPQSMSAAEIERRFSAIYDLLWQLAAEQDDSNNDTQPDGAKVIPFPTLREDRKERAA